MIERAVAALFCVVAGLVSGCTVVEDAGDCAKLRSQGACEDADPFGEAQCVWLEVAIVVPGEDCADATTRERCVGFSGTAQGCTDYACGAEESADDPILFHRVLDDGAIEVLRGPSCGPTPAGGWDYCTMSSPESCACGCDLAE